MKKFIILTILLSSNFYILKCSTDKELAEKTFTRLASKMVDKTNLENLKALALNPELLTFNASTLRSIFLDFFKSNDVINPRLTWTVLYKKIRQHKQNHHSRTYRKK